MKTERKAEMKTEVQFHFSFHFSPHNSCYYIHSSKFSPCITALTSYLEQKQFFIRFFYKKDNFFFLSLFHFILSCEKNMFKKSHCRLQMITCLHFCFCFLSLFLIIHILSDSAFLVRRKQMIKRTLMYTTLPIHLFQISFISS